MIRKALSLLCLFVLLAFFSGTASAQAEYRITEPELTRLEQIFSQLSSNNRLLLNDLAASRQDLMTAQQKLEKYQTDLEKLQEQLVTLKTELAQAQSELKQANTSLRRANESLNKYEAEVRSEIRSLSLQRNGLILLAIILSVT